MKHKYTMEAFTYRMLNKGDTVNNTLGTLLKSATRITVPNITSQLYDIKRNFHYPLKTEVLKAVEEGKFLMLYHRSVKMPSALPYLVMQGDNRTVVPVIFMDTFGLYNEESDTLNIDARKLYCLLESSYISAKYILKSDINLNTNIISNGAKIYSAIITRVLNRIYALNTDKNKFDRVTFITACFYLINLLGMDMIKKRDNIINYASLCCKSPNGILLEQYFNSFVNNPDKDAKNPFTDIETFITRLAQMEDSFKKLTVRSFLEAYISTYGSTMLLGLEIFEYFAFNMSSVMMKAFMNNEYVIQNLVDNNLPAFYTSLVKL